MTLKAKLLSCLAILALSEIVLGFAAYGQMTSLTASMRTILEDRVIPMQQLKRVSDFYAVNIVDTTQKLNSGSLGFDEADQAMKAAREGIEETWNAYAATGMTAEESGIVSRFVVARTQSDLALQPLWALVAARDRAGIARFAATDLYPAVDPLSGPLNQLIALQSRVTDALYRAAMRQSALVNEVFAGFLVVGLAIFGLTLWLIQSGVITPLARLQEAMYLLAKGEVQLKIYGLDRRDEVGAMAAAVAVFRDNAMQRQTLETDIARNRAEGEAARAAGEAARQRAADEVQAAADGLAAGLDELARGVLTCRLQRPFAPHLDHLRVTFNTSLHQLEQALQMVGEKADAIAHGTMHIREEAHNLSRRTETQAASVEQTSAALEEISVTSRQASERAEEVGRLVARASAAAVQSETVVGHTVDAMNSIETSSREISNIISVIDEIAFQTNLLALNAGVEAARAGEAGKGFAVVAMEVRELAQRSAKAAKDIKDLIRRSSEQVSHGVMLVAETGDALQKIVAEVRDIGGHVRVIAEASREQSTGIAEINSTVSVLDQGTQQNAAMVEETTAACNSLSEETHALAQLLTRFAMGRPQARQRAA